MNTLTRDLVENREFSTQWEKVFFKMMSHITHGEIIIVSPDGNRTHFVGPHKGETVTIKINDWKFCEDLFMKGDIGLGEAYIEGSWDSDNISNLIKFGVENSNVLERAIKGSLIKIIFYRFKHLLNRNSKKGSERNIHAHYDLGNNFYKLWLDSTMTYSSGIFRNANESLSESQKNKYQNIIDQLSLKDGDHILEVGCGWGGFMEHASSLGIEVTGVTISKEQFEFAMNRLEKNADRAKVRYQDYRDIQGKFDHIVSIEMFEALGEEYWGKYFKKLYSLLKPGGQLIVQTITINDNDFKSYRKGTDFIQQYIFPGGMLPSPKAFEQSATREGFVLENSFEFGLDYGKTLALWEKNFQNVLDQVRSIGFDEKFIRTWRFYLKYCQGGFEAGKISVFQFNLKKQEA